MFNNERSCLFIALLLVVSATVLSQTQYDLVLHNGRVIDPETSLDAIRDEYAQRPPSDIYGTQAEDIHHFVELELVKRIADLGFKLHTGRSRNEQIATDLRLFVREKCTAITARLADWVGALIGQARAEGTSGGRARSRAVRGRTSG